MNDKPLLYFDAADGEEIRTLLKKHDIKYTSIAALSFNFKDMVELAEQLVTPSAWAAFSAVIISWIQRDKKRSIKFRMNDGKATTIDMEGMNVEEMERMLTVLSKVQIEFSSADKE